MSNLKFGKSNPIGGIGKALFIILLYFSGMSHLIAFQSKPENGDNILFTHEEEALSYDFNECASFSGDNSPWDYSEFTAAIGNSCANVTGGQIYRHDGKHSCTDDEHGNAGDAACFQSSKDQHYTANHALAIRVDVQLSADNGKASRLNGISFKQLAPHNYKWSNTGYTPTTGPNNYPTKFGIRVLKDGSEIYRISDLKTTQTWYTSEFNFNHNVDFMVTAGTSSTFTFELYSYAPIGNGAAVSAWDLDDLKVFTSCEEECDLTVDAGEDQEVCVGEEVVLTANAHNEAACSKIIASYKIKNSNTEAGCFTADPGVIFQKGGNCNGIDYIWRAGADLVLNEYENNTAIISGSVIDQNGRVATVDIKLSDKENSGKTWDASCYVDGISGPETYYRSFIGAITVDGVAQSVGTRFNSHYILANGAGFDSNQFGLGAWTGGAFGECTEWFGNLEPMTIENPNQEVTYLWSTGETTKSITVTESGSYTVEVKDCKGCMAEDVVNVVVNEPKAYVLDGGADFCIDGESDFLTDSMIAVSGNTMGANSTFVITDEAGNILGLPGTLDAVKGVDFDGAGAGTCLVWHLAFEDGLQGAGVGNNANDLEGCFALSNPISVVRTATKAYVLEGGADFCIDGESDFLTDNMIAVSGNTMGANSTFVITDEAGNILGLPGTLDAVKGVDFDGAGAGTCLVWYLAFEDGLQGAAVGNNANDLEGCFALSNPIKVVRNAAPIANAGDDVTICDGEEVMLTATGGTNYLWSTGETTASIKVSPNTKTTYTVTVSSEEGCTANDEVMVNVDSKVNIGDFVWLDENRNGLQDDGNTGLNDVKVTLYTCDGSEVTSTITTTNSNGESGAYNFEVCPNSGEYYVVFGDLPEGLEFTTTNAGNTTLDSNADENGRTSCFEITDADDLSIDGGLTEICNIQVDAGDTAEICEDEVIELTADILENTADCPGGCTYPIKTQDRCYGPTGNFEVYLVSTGSVENFKFVASEQKFERLADNSLKYKATATNGKDIIEVNAMLTGYTNIAPVGSPKANSCQDYDSADWEYWTTWTGTISSRDHGVFNLSVKGAAFQMGVGADAVRTGFGASGWFYVDGGDGFYTDGDINLALEECVEDNILYEWTTEDGNIISDSNSKTIKVNKPGTYEIKVVNCLDCEAIDSITITEGSCYTELKRPTPSMMSVYPVPVRSGGTVTVTFDINDQNTESDIKSISLKGSVDYIQRKEDVGVMLYDVTGRIIAAPRMFKIENGKATIYVDINHIPSGKYILRAQGSNWSDSKQILVQ